MQNQAAEALGPETLTLTKSTEQADQHCDSQLSLSTNCVVHRSTNVLWQGRPGGTPASSALGPKKDEVLSNC